MNNQLSIYIHYPFCQAKCPYCDFNSHVKRNIDEKRFLQGYLREIEYFAGRIKNKKIKTIFFGGGTPSLMSANMVDQIINQIGKFWDISDDVEITLEANPGSFEVGKFIDFKKSGINRLSLGIQALNNEDLQFLGRVHDVKEALFAIKKGREIFDNFSFDLIYGRPNQDLDKWQNELDEAIGFGSDHLSLYQLTIEKGTQFFGDVKRGKFVMHEADVQAQFYEMTNKICYLNGFNDYEISNYAKKGFESRHNLTYWQSNDYIGIGAGAHSRVYFDDEEQKRALMMIHEPQKWLEGVEKSSNGLQQNYLIDEKDLLEEVLIMGLRLKDGIGNEVFLRHFGKNIGEIFDLEKFGHLKELLLIDDDRIVAVGNGKNLLNSLICAVLEVGSSVVSR